MEIIERYDDIVTLNPIVIEGNYKTKEVWINSKQLLFDDSKIIFDHFTPHFSWGSSGPGAAQLALAILFEITKNKKISMILHHVFKNEFFAHLSQSDFKITLNIGEWFRNNIEKDNMFLK